MVQLGNTVLAFGGCNLEGTCSNDVFLQTPQMTEEFELTCGNGGKRRSLNQQHDTVPRTHMCDCTDTSGADEHLVGQTCEQRVPFTPDAASRLFSMVE